MHYDLFAGYACVTEKPPIFWYHLLTEKDNKDMIDFYKRLALAGEAIPCGRVATFGQLALLCGKPGNSRQVGYALNRGLAGKNLPAHRVVNSQGFLTGAPAFDTPDMQKCLLEEEGVEVREGRVDLKKYGWHNTLEEALTLKESFRRLGI